MKTDKAFIVATVRASAFALITLIYSSFDAFSGLLWCVYIGFFLTMAFGAKRDELLSYALSLLAGFVWSFGYMKFPGIINGAFAFGSTPSLVIAEFIMTFAVIFVHLKFLMKTPFNKVPAVFAAVATVFASGGTDRIVLCAFSGIIGIAMAVLTQCIIELITNRKL